MEVDMVSSESRYLRSGSAVNGLLVMCLIAPYEIITVIVSLLAAHTYFNLIMSGFSCGFEEVLREKLPLLIEIVSRSLPGQLSECAVWSRQRRKGRTHVVDKDVYRILHSSNQLSRIIPLTSLFNTTGEVTLERFFSPWAFGRIGDWSKSTCGPIRPGCGCEVNRESTVAAH